MARVKQEDYAYATARIRAREQKLLSRNKLERLFEIKDYSDAVKIMVESGYGSEQTDGRKGEAENLDAVLSAELEETYDLIGRMVPDPQIIDLFRKRYDYLNAKLILKAEALKIEAGDSLSKLGTIEPARLQKLIVGRKLTELPEVFSRAILESLEAFNASGDPQMIDFLMDKACFRDMAADAKASEDPFLVRLTDMLIDTANLRILIRSRLLDKPGDFIRKAWVKGGSFSSKLFEEMENKGLDKLFEVLKSLGREKLAAELSEAIGKPDGISEVEKILDDYIMHFLKESKFVTMGIEPVIGYLFFKETEIKNARLIITGVMNKIPRETIRERLRLGYA
ncbi:MAG TPA: V-type ATP synthase subunit C [Clostridiaceae bacterium]|jgi:V/A-type H+-transporting ATPase subunit C|nr:V-type ATP synthase subunit C [Clostridiaceae bacterium]